MVDPRSYRNLSRAVRQVPNTGELMPELLAELAIGCAKEEDDQTVMDLTESLYETWYEIQRTLLPTDGPDGANDQGIGVW